MSDVERFYESARKHFPASRPWHELHPMEQINVVQAINVILSTFQEKQ